MLKCNVCGYQEEESWVYDGDQVESGKAVYADAIGAPEEEENWVDEEEVISCPECGSAMEEN